MKPTSPTRHHVRHDLSKSDQHRRGPLWVRTWVLACMVSSGVFALLWLLLRTGTKPSRFAYPCQQAALSTAALAFGAPVVSALITARRRLLAGLRTPMGITTAAVGLVLAVGIGMYLSAAAEYQGPVLTAGEDYIAEVYHVSNCPEDPIGDRFVGVDNLITAMGRGGLRFYRSDTESLIAGPDGIIASDDVVIIKINYQWGQRGGTNTDVLRGVIRRVVGHPDTFTGEIVVCENAQFNSVDNFDRTENNAQDHGLSPHDVIVGFQGQGFDVSHFDWTARRGVSVGEYSEGDMRSGYVVYDYDAEIHGRASYPKFQTDYGTYISPRFGIWDADSETYDRDHLKFINIPVLKSHHATYGATACVKNYMGLVTDLLGTSSHSGIRYGLLGDVLGKIAPADLNILDCIWINANPYSGPWTSYAVATRRDELVASVDPVAADIWSVKNILIPAFLENGYEPPWPYPSADPDNPNSSFRVYLDNSMNQILDDGYDVTNDLDRIDLLTWNGAGDADGDSDVDLLDFADFDRCMSGPGAFPPPGCQVHDFNEDGDVDWNDFAAFEQVFSGPL